MSYRYLGPWGNLGKIHGSTQIACFLERGKLSRIKTFTRIVASTLDRPSAMVHTQLTKIDSRLSDPERDHYLRYLSQSTTTTCRHSKRSDLQQLAKI